MFDIMESQLCTRSSQRSSFVFQMYFVLRSESCFASDGEKIRRYIFLYAVSNSIVTPPLSHTFYSFVMLFPSWLYVDMMPAE